MKNLFLLICELLRSLPLCWLAFKAEVNKIKDSSFYSEANVMIKSFFKAIDAMIRAVIYLLILVIGLTVTALGSYIVLFVAIRTVQLLWTFLFKEPWL